MSVGLSWQKLHMLVVWQSLLECFLPPWRRSCWHPRLRSASLGPGLRPSSSAWRGCRCWRACTPSAGHSGSRSLNSRSADSSVLTAGSRLPPTAAYKTTSFSEVDFIHEGQAVSLRVVCDEFAFSLWISSHCDSFLWYSELQLQYWGLVVLNKTTVYRTLNRQVDPSETCFWALCVHIPGDLIVSAARSLYVQVVVSSLCSFRSRYWIPVTNEAKQHQ